MQRLFYAIVFTAFWAVNLLAQTLTLPTIQWQRTFGGTTNESRPAIRQASDGGYLLVGGSQSGISGTKQSTNYGRTDGWLIRLDRNGNQLWEHSFGGSQGDNFTDARQTPDGGWLLAGNSSSPPSGTKTSPFMGYWVVRLDANGELLWDHGFGGDSNDRVATALPTAEGGYLVGGWSMSGSNGNKTLPNIPDVDGYPRGPDYWLLRVNATGDIVWQKVYGGAREDNLFAIEAASDGRFICVGSSASAPGGNGNKTSPLFGAEDFWIVCIDADGEIVWDKSFGGLSLDTPTKICAAGEGGWVIAGFTYSGIGGNKTTPHTGDGWWDVWLLRLDPDGNKIWEHTIGDIIEDEPIGLFPAPDGGFYLCVAAARPQGPLTWLIRLDGNGQRLWEQTYPQREPFSFSIRSSQFTSDGGFIIAGESWSASNADFVLRKITPDPLITPQLRVVTPEVRLTLKGITGKTYVLEHTTDFLNWVPFGTNTLGSTAIELTDSNTPPQKFYRAWMVP